MPMIDFYASEATFAHPHNLARDLAGAVMRWEQGARHLALPEEHRRLRAPDGASHDLQYGWRK